MGYHASQDSQVLFMCIVVVFRLSSLHVVNEIAIILAETGKYCIFNIQYLLIRIAHV